MKFIGDELYIVNFLPVILNLFLLLFFFKFLINFLTYVRIIENTIRYPNVEISKITSRSFGPSFAFENKAGLEIINKENKITIFRMVFGKRGHNMVIFTTRKNCELK